MSIRLQDGRVRQFPRDLLAPIMLVSMKFFIDNYISNHFARSHQNKTARSCEEIGKGWRERLF